MATDTPSTAPDTEAEELKGIVQKYPKLFFRLLVGVLLLVGSGVSAWGHSFYKEFKAVSAQHTIILKATESLKVADTEAMKDRQVILDTLTRREVESDRRFNEQRQDIQEIRKDIKEILRHSRAASTDRDTR